MTVALGFPRSSQVYHVEKSRLPRRREFCASEWLSGDDLLLFTYVSNVSAHIGSSEYNLPKL